MQPAAMHPIHSPHTPVMLTEVVEALRVIPDGVYVDATYGRGGHSRALLAQLGPAGRLFAFDRDPDACAHAWRELGREPRFRIERSNFAQLGEILTRTGLKGGVHGILLDLGVSSPQFEDAARGFSFSREGPLDMRMDPQSGESAAEWLAHASREEISEVLKVYGEERWHWKIAGAIERARAQAPIETTAQLAEIMAGAVPKHGPQRIHPATRSFQALRIFLNRELAELDAVLPQCVELLAPGGRLAVISFHSLEDRIVKRFLRTAAHPPHAPLPQLPDPQPSLRLIGKAQRPDALEIAGNPRARSAVLRVAERTAV